MITDLKIEPAFEEKRITTFIEETLEKTGFHHVVLAVSGGVDSATSLNLLSKVLSTKNIYVVHLYYFDSSVELFKAAIAKIDIPQENILLSPITALVDALGLMRGIHEPANDTEYLRRGNMMARLRMILLYDFARQHNALVCGTENRSEYHLGYFTRFGDAASDFEPLHHLYKTQVYELARHLGVPEKIRTTPPTAGLWKNQTDEKELGFSYEEADPVLYLYFDKKHTLEEIKNRGFSKVKEIVKFAMKNGFKHEVPYII
ncbi:NAD(+) synthase [Candidatus Roizmanbacteria bacterium RIFCSPLOWO2_01_FULL_38_12]|uniref:NH(3)-dependent NAD(+) synthetase n=1 Tax=Candidatus Roizmanbacteria bacterium RIFCSPLOWO2_01_FULL_38_12 TaxID=1802061 RepID=A0A1F7IYS0_9BACT|nr:MAG: NAD(+) synthase [Candidatus Roizmanbacteria bacterium RIFCSPHIGHO2_12_FULL_38_13]OGK48513.1 MAG: NAD(+) synthase [Candidatus Roizmanbacteria bacterium RIFCSPLOWO2_01_FULL_38_12]